MKITLVNAIWCNACLVMKKIWKEIEKEYPNLEIIKYDYDIDEEDVKKLNITDKLPVAIFTNSKEENRLIGEKTKKELETIIERMMQ